MKQYLETNERRRIEEIRNHCLSLRDFHWEDDGEFDKQGGPSSTMEALEEIQEFIDASYRMFSNPLPHLRNHFPGFRWDYFPTASLRAEEVNRLVAALDFDYALAVRSDLYGAGIVTATTETAGKERRRVCFWTHKDVENFRHCRWPQELLKRGYAFLARRDEYDTAPWVITR